MSRPDQRPYSSIAGRSAARVRSAAADCEPAPPVNKARREYRSEEHTSELQSHSDLVCRLLLEKKKKSTLDFNLLHINLLGPRPMLALSVTVYYLALIE